ncbi:hypothetical protein [Pontibacter litorisediminis]|uniref:hypothetical protein n=1 Tax=Pontibacter litorisediminis TaxID=1846260 RepID=UPI0023EC47E2|nr:hypothetical protein [Pontibacter litorisediminis]
MRVIKYLLRLIGRWPDILGLPLAIILFILSAPLLRWLDPTSAVFDLGILQKLALGGIAMLMLNAAVFLGIKFNFPKVYAYYKDVLPLDFFKITPCQRLYFFLSLYALLFVAGALLVSLI